MTSKKMAEDRQTPVAREKRLARWQRFLEEEVWPTIPAAVKGKRLSKAEREESLGYGPEGV